MSIPAGKVPIFESVKAGFAAARGNLVPLLPAALIGALVVTVFNVLSARAGLSGNLLGQFFFQILTGAGIALFFTAALRASAGAGAGINAGTIGLAIKVFAALAIVGFFLAIVFLVGAIPGFIVLGSVFAPYQSQLESVQGDVAGSMALMETVFRENGAAILLVVIVYSAIWLALTSRLYLCAPASVEENRIATFETWRWTQGNLLRISAARLLLLSPVLIVVAIIQAAATAAFGVDSGDPQAMTALVREQPALHGAISFLAAFASLILYGACEAGLSQFLYRGLKPPP